MGAEQTEDEKKISEALEKVAAEHKIESVTTIALVRSCHFPQRYPSSGSNNFKGICYAEGSIRISNHRRS
jgi:hypothetical protein